MAAAVTTDVYLSLLTAVVQRFMVLMGPPGLRLARRVYLQVGDDGVVTGYRGEGSVALQSLIVEYMGLLGPELVMPLARRVLKPLMERHPGIELPPLLR